MVINREQDRPTRWIKEAVHIRKEGHHRAMNRDEGSYQLSHAYDRFLDATVDCRIKTRKNWVPASSDKDLVMTSKRQKCLVVIDEFLTVSLHQPNEFISWNMGLGLSRSNLIQSTLCVKLGQNLVVRQ